MDQYESHSKVTKISATSRVAVKIKDNYYTVEYAEEREITPGADVDMKLERQILFDAVNKCVDTQVEDIVNSFKH